MTGTVTIQIGAHWVNGWFLRLAARPVVRCNSTDHPARWSQPLELEVDPGRHRIAVGVRYRGMSRVLGTQEAPIDLAEGEHQLIVFRNGLFNHQPFTPRWYASNIAPTPPHAPPYR